MVEEAVVKWVGGETLGFVADVVCVVLGAVVGGSKPTDAAEVGTATCREVVAGRDSYSHAIGIGKANTGESPDKVVPVIVVDPILPPLKDTRT